MGMKGQERPPRSVVTSSDRGGLLIRIRAQSGVFRISLRPPYLPSGLGGSGQDDLTPLQTSLTLRHQPLGPTFPSLRDTYFLSHSVSSHDDKHPEESPQWMFDHLQDEDPSET